MANGQQKAQQNLEAFISWSSTMTDDDFRQIVHRGQLNRVEVSKGVGCAKSVLLQNPRVRALLDELEVGLRKRGVLPQLTDAANSVQDLPKVHDRTLLRRSQDSKRVAELEQEILTLKMQLERFKELSEVIHELGLDEL
ncbi:VPA1267 family protein [Shewanella sp. GutDb-MelDb]|uniref:VPA1267 family protein n=1 Tax=Shewanella sp. GutDb-MelDb TaxID=2058316 RepID=UPI000C7AD1FF|nr:VPA1267 family protein [Shewanella sp. GutDb-MelDb]PKG55233.1 hypothetical protein CXF82_20610 [Shewanella sp. GutDb-MelDb]